MSLLRPFPGFFSLAVATGVGLLAFAGSAAIATTPETVAETALSKLLQTLIVDNIPHDFDNKKDWGKTTRVMNGLSIKNDGDGPKLREHTHEVNDGVWKEYHATITDPQQQLHVRLANLHAGAPGHTVAQLILNVQMHGDARIEQWKDGIKLLNANADLDAALEITIGCDVAWHWNSSGLLGELVVEPKITSVDIKLLDFRLNRLSKLSGWAAKEVGETFRGTVSHELHQQEPKLVAKINAAIQKKQDHLRFAPEQALAGGVGKIQSLLHFGDSTPPEKPKPDPVH